MLFVVKSIKKRRRKRIMACGERRARQHTTGDMDFLVIARTRLNLPTSETAHKQTERPGTRCLACLVECGRLTRPSCFSRRRKVGQIPWQGPRAKKNAVDIFFGRNTCLRILQVKATDPPCWAPRLVFPNLWSRPPRGLCSLH